jgi:hypothetical protein
LKLLRLAGVGVLVLLGVWVTAEAGARWYLHRALSTGWPLPSGRLAEIATLFPTQPETSVARQLETGALPLGIDVFPRVGGPRPSEQLPPIKAWKAVEESTKSYIQASVQLNTPAVTTIPPSVAAFIEAQANTLGTVETILISNPPPQWSIDLQKGVNAPLPNLLGNISLVRLLVASALHHRGLGDMDRAWRDLQAASRLPEGLLRRPELISQAIGRYEANLIIGTMRQLTGPPPPWALDWPGVDSIRQMDLAAMADAWIFYQAFDTQATSDLFTAFSGPENRPTLGGRSLSTAFSSYLRASAANAASCHRDLLRELARLPACTQTVVAPTAEQVIPKWNVFGKIVFIGDSLGLGYRRLHLFLAQLEGTRLILGARRAKQETKVWPRTAPSIASPCTVAPWSYAVDSSGKLSLAARTPFATIGTPKALALPQSFSEEQ